MRTHRKIQNIKDIEYPERYEPAIDWISRISDSKIRSRAIEAYGQAKHGGSEPMASNICEAIRKGFTWDRTYQGDEFWREVVKDIALGRLKPYKEYRKFETPFQDKILKTHRKISKVQVGEVASKSVIWFLMQIPDRRIRQRAINQCVEENKNNQAPNLCDAITSAFSWERSNEGLAFWTDVTYDLRIHGKLKRGSYYDKVLTNVEKYKSD